MFPHLLVGYTTPSKTYQTLWIKLYVNLLFTASLLVINPEKLINFLITIIVNQLLRGL